MKTKRGQYINMNETEQNNELRKIIQSSTVNFLIGAGASNPYLPPLGDIEKNIEEAKGDDAKVIKELKKYFSGVMAPSLSILNNGEDLSQEIKVKFDKTYSGYKVFFEIINNILLNRKSTLLNKQVNVFTTNIDIFLEKVCEDLGLEYNDGFSGNINPQFQTSNFRKSVFKTSAHFSNIAEIPTFNIIKLHGSLTWQLNDLSDGFSFSNLQSLESIQDIIDDDKKFKDAYSSELQIVNPAKSKFEATVMGVAHYELLRMYSDELEKENSVLFVIGFSMADEHIREITKRAANSNPTLKVYIFCYSNGETKATLEELFKDMRYQNVEIVSPPEDKNYDIETISLDFLDTVVGKNDNTDEKTSEDAEDKEDEE